MTEKLTVKELVKALRCCLNGDCNECPLREDTGCISSLDRQSADTLESLAAENKGLRENNKSRRQTEEAALKQLSDALAENTRLAEQISRAQQPNEALTNFDYITASLENLINTIELSRSCKTCPASASCKITTGEMTCHQARLAWLNQPYVRPPEAGEKG